METDSLENLMLSQTSAFNKRNSSEIVYDATFSGFPIMLGIITVLHFVFQYFNQSAVGLASNVTDDFMKDIFWATIIFSIIDYGQVKDKVNNYFIAKLVGLLAFEAAAIVLSLLSAMVFGTDNIMYDAFPFVAGAALGQYAVHTVFNKPAYQIAFNRVSKLAIASIAIVLSISSFHSIGAIFNNSSIKANQLKASR